MKHFILYLLLNCILFSSCKIDKKISSSNLLNATQQGSVIKQDQVEQETAKSLKEKLIGTIYRKTYEIPEFKSLSSGGHLIGNYKNGYKFKGKSYSLITIEADYDVVKYIIFDVAENEIDKNPNSIIVDLLEINKKQQQLITKENAFFIYNLHKNGKQDPELFALVSYNKKTEELTNIYNVWRTNRETERIEEVKDFSGIKIIEEDEDY